MPTARSAQVYADFLLPHLSPEVHLVDVGCGSGELSLDLAPHVGHVIGVDIDETDVEKASRNARQRGIHNVTFVTGDVCALDLASGHADAVFAHSVLEAIDRPNEALVEMKRLLKPGGVVAAASVEYGGLILTGLKEDLLRRFYSIRERLWLIEGADPYLGRRLRGLFLGAGITDVVATTTYISYGTVEGVREFGLGRAEDCTDDWYVGSALRHGLVTWDDLEAMRLAWLDWSESPTSYAAFAWCRALGRKP